MRCYTPSFFLALISLVLLMGCSTEQTPSKTITYTFAPTEGPERALGSLAEKNNFDTMEEPTYDEGAALDPYNNVESMFYMNEAALGSVYRPTSIYRAQGT